MCVCEGSPEGGAAGGRRLRLFVSFPIFAEIPWNWLREAGRIRDQKGGVEGSREVEEGRWSGMISVAHHICAIY